MCPSGSSSTSFVWRAVRSPFARSLLAALGWLALPAPALAQLAPVAQSRSASFSWNDSEGTYFCLPPPTGCTPVNVVHSDDQGDDQAPDFASFATSLGGIVALDSSALGPQGFSASATHAASAYALLGAASENLGKFDDAAQAYARSAELAPEQYRQVDGRLGQARALRLAGKAPEALTVLRGILSRYSKETPGVAEAEVRLSELTSGAM